MCGVAGFLGKPGLRSTLHQIAERMGDAIRHRGPDDQGSWIDESAGLALSHRRLSVLDLSAAGHQPMQSASSRFVVAFNGEIYNHGELRRELERSGRIRSWRGHSDTETLLACFEAFGVRQSLSRLTGMFAVAVWDRASATLTLARDRAGEKPLYYGWQEGTFMFASEIGALKVHPSFRSTIDRNALTLLLRRNYIPSPHAIYEGIYKLPPGCALQLKANDSGVYPKLAAADVVSSYWSMAEVAARLTSSPFEGSDDEALAELERRLTRAVTGQMMSDVPLGALLSGGVDSSLVTALMQSHSARPIRTFTIGFESEAYDEAKHASAVARHLGTEHTELRVSGRDALQIVPELAGVYSEPFADSSQLPTYMVMRMARQHVTVALSGDAADELFGGYSRYILVPAVCRKARLVPSSARRIVGHTLTSIPSSHLNRWATPVATLLGVSQVGDKLHKLGKRVQDAGTVDDLYASLVTEWGEGAPVLGGGEMHDLLSDRSQWPPVGDPASRMMLLDALTYLPDDILVKVDRAAMAVSLETRTPYLDREVMEFAWSLPLRMKVRAGKGKWLLRRVLDRYVPASLTGRPKMGFGIPLDHWLRQELRPWAEDLLSVDRMRRDGFLDPKPIRKIWDEHLSERASHGYRLWSILMFQSWLERNA